MIPVEKAEIAEGGFVIELEDKEKEMEKRANKIFDAVIEDLEIGKLGDLKKRLSEFEEKLKDNYFIRLKIRVEGDEETEGWVFNEYLNIDRVVKEKKAHPKSKIYKLIKKYVRKNKINIYDLKGVRIKVITNERGYARILL